VNPSDSQTDRAQPAGVVIRDYSPRFSNWRATGAFEEFLVQQGVVGIRDVDTRALAAHLRDHGEMKGLIASGTAELDQRQLLAELKAAPSPFAGDLVRAGDGRPQPPAVKPFGPELTAEGQPKHRLTILDLGVTRDLLRQLAALDCAVELLPPATPPAKILAAKPERLLVVGGPGDPRRAEYAVATLKGLLGKLPILGLGLGCQVLALALGGRVERMKVGHHGVNHPVRELTTRTPGTPPENSSGVPGGLPGVPVVSSCAITVQHHSFVVLEQPLPAGVEVSHRNVNDGTVEGVRSPKLRARGVQFHPAPDEMGRPSALLARFLEGPDA
jgi:carbamoyl-phosphate synthase small subunit